MWPSRFGDPRAPAVAVVEVQLRGFEFEAASWGWVPIEGMAPVLTLAGLRSLQPVLPHFVIEETAVDAKKLCGLRLVAFRLSQCAFE